MVKKKMIRAVKIPHIIAWYVMVVSPRTIWSQETGVSGYSDYVMAILTGILTDISAMQAKQ